LTPLRRAATAALAASVATAGLVVMQAGAAQAVYPCKLDRMVDFGTDRAGLRTHAYNGGVCTAAAVRHWAQPPSSGGAYWTNWVGYAGTVGWSGQRWDYPEPNLVKGQTCRGTGLPVSKTNPGNCHLDSTFTNTSWVTIGP
jgi:hypothetical protein